MKYTIIYILLFLLPSCTKTTVDSSVSNISLNNTHKSIINASNDFGFDLYKEAIKNVTDDKNVILSPLSVSIALSMLLNGAKNQSEKEILNTLRLNISTAENNIAIKELIQYLPKADPKVKVSIANSFWSRKDFPIEFSFTQVLKDHFSAESNSLDFGNSTTTLNAINGWVSNATSGKITTILDEIKPEHVAFIINAVYFNAPWTKEFDPKKTFKSNFTKLDGQSISVDMMSSDEMEIDAYQDQDIQIVRIPYGNKQYSVTLIMTYDISKFKSTESQIGISKFNEYNGKLSLVGKGAMIQLPKFEVDFDISLNNALKTMGMLNLFGSSADLSGISKMGKLFVDEVKHKTYIKFSEQGTEAAAATSIGIGITSAPPTFTFDKPFLVYITEKKTGAILFNGRVVNP